ncbi:Protein FAM192A [Colletotrichum chlorophyti]|uniref:Protein FAM192A n=1 Tax=Colletotrichum chlorophyti TaxID=708187 RepID=A0A1Q8RU30_9PEZI|nr:Protein FAM192A [Colletotrichum chlorophyti]
MSRFVSAGAINAETGEAVVVKSGAGDAGVDKRGGSDAVPRSGPDAKKNAEWEIVQKELDAERKRREEARVKNIEGGERSLYDVLQANKAAKQAAFEEQNRIKNQFRALDDDEIEFLDEVRSSARAEEERVRREMEEGLEAFRRARGVKRGGDGDDTAPAPAPPTGGDGVGEEWAFGPRKRRKGREVRFGLKKEKTGGENAEEKKAGGGEEEQREKERRESEKGSPPAPVPAKGKLGLVAYGSDSEDDDDD